jgi:hypothetical protein
VTSGGLDPAAQFEHALSEELDSVAFPDDLTALERIGMAASAALLLDLMDGRA